MRAVALDYRRKRLEARDVPPPRLSAEDQVLFRVREVGVCGTDRELSGFHIGYPPAGRDYMVLGHEALGQVVETGRNATALGPGDWVAPMIRRSCEPPCINCGRGRRDLCASGGYHERGIFGADGYFAEYAVDAAADLARIPPELVDVAVLVEPLSVVEKAVGRALRHHEGEPRTALVVGAGTIGILAALVLQDRGLRAHVLSLESPEHPRARLARDAGMEYWDAPPGRKADIVIEATGSREGAGRALEQIGPLGVCCILGASDAAGVNRFRNFILYNQVVFGSVNADPASFARAVEDLARLDGNILRRLIRRVRFDGFPDSILGPVGESAKVVHVIQE